MPRLVPLAMLLAACAAQPQVDEGPELAVCEDGPTATFVVSSLAFTRPDDNGRINGFNLDDTTTLPGEGAGCGVPDDTSPDGEPGIDNAFAKLLPALALTEAQAIEEIVQSTINDGSLIIMFRINGIDDPVNDTCATFDVVRGLGIPRVGAQGFINAWQTFDEDRSVAVAHGGESAIVDGVMVTSGVDVELVFGFLGETISIELLDGNIRTELHEDGTASGILGGGIDVANVLSIAAIGGIADEVFDLLQGLLGNVTDLVPDETGACTQVSVSMDFTAVPAFIYDTPPGDTGR